MLSKVIINGEAFEWDSSRRPMEEALALEEAMAGHFPNYAAWESALAAVSIRALAGMVWLTYRRAGRDVPLADIFSGKAEVDLNDLTFERDEGEADPTAPPPEALDTTGGDTSEPSPKS